ncbi:MAG: S8 family serine peptidase, partial [Caldilineaceae bacterium]|nr:S8 family serine peptidase [Caldilineaceae bacterium]
MKLDRVFYRLLVVGAIVGVTLSTLLIRQPVARATEKVGSVNHEQVQTDPLATPTTVFTLTQSKPTVDNRLAARMATAATADQIPVIIKFQTKANLRGINDRARSRRIRRIIQRLQATATAEQRVALRQLRQAQRRGDAAQIRPLWIVNAIAASATSTVINELSTLAGVDLILPDEAAIQPVGLQAIGNSPQSNLLQINAQGLWGLGQHGEGVVIAALDTGVDGSHVDLAGSWRGGSNSWFDPYGEYPTFPTDAAGTGSGHGTAVMGIMVGGENSGNTIGVAPGASWIAAKIFNAQGSATIAAIHEAFQWVLDPDGDPTTDDAPDVVNNSWTFQTPGCDLEFEVDLQALQAAGILPIFAAGNGGPGSDTSYSPANNPSAFAVGAVDGGDQVYLYGSRGPAACGGPAGIYPDLVAPGVAIASTDLYGLYQQQSGTSMAAPHTSGALALLLQSFPGLTAAEQRAGLINGALDLGALGP